MTDQQPKILPCPDPECFGEISKTVDQKGELLGYDCYVCGLELAVTNCPGNQCLEAVTTEKVGRIASQSTELAQVRQELENAMEQLTASRELSMLDQEAARNAAGSAYWREQEYKARIAELERKLAEAEERAGLFEQADEVRWSLYTTRVLVLGNDDPVAAGIEPADMPDTDSPWWLGMQDFEQQYTHLIAAGSRAQCLTALRRELEGKEVDRA